MKDKLTKKEKDLMPVFVKKWTDIFNNNTTYNEDKVKEGITWVYTELCNLKEPTIYIVDSPLACQKLANKLNGNPKIKYYESSPYLCYQDASWVSFYDYFTEIGVLKDEKFNRYRDLISNGIYYTLTFENVAITSKPPVEVHQNSDGVLHNTNGPAYKFADGYCAYYVMGRQLEKEYFIKAQTLEGASKLFLKEENEDIKACIIDIVKSNFGENGVMDMLGAKTVHAATIVHSNGHSEEVKLHKSKKKYSYLMDHLGNTDQPYAWLELKCPSTGATYMQTTSPAFTTVQEALKFSRPNFVPIDLDYDWKEFTN